MHGCGLDVLKQASRTTPQRQTLIQEQRAVIRYLDYDWGLNDVRK